MPSRSRIAFSIAAVASLAFLVPAQASAAGAGSAPGVLGCGHAWSDRDPGFGHVIPASAPMHTGPHASCTTILNVRSSDGLDYHCFVFNESGNTWSHVRISNTNIQGWIWDDYLTELGSSYQC